MRAIGATCLVLLAIPAAADSGFSHHKQFGVAARLPFGYRGIVPYSGDNYCGDTDSSTDSGFAPVCTKRAPISLDLEVGYGVKRSIDLFLELRIGLETDFGPTPASDDGPRSFHLSPGARFFFSETDRARIFTTAQLVIDFAGYEDAGGKSLGTDFGARNMSGVWIDLARQYGFFVYLGSTATFARWLRFEGELGVGIQGRYP